MRYSDKLAGLMARNMQPVGTSGSACCLTSCLVVRSARILPQCKSPKHVYLRQHHGSLERVGQRRRYHMHISASWGAPVDWKTAEVVENKKAADQLQRVLIKVGDVAKAYDKAGQYVQFKVGDSKPGFFAVASAPSVTPAGGVLEFLVKQQGDTATLLCNAKPGDQVDVSPIMGKGFPVDRVPPGLASTIYIFATGTGIAPIKALIESGTLQAGARENVTLYYGTKDENTTAYLKSIPEWKAAGVNVVNVYSGVQNVYVQDAFLEDITNLDGPKTAAILCGQRELGEALTLILTDRGVPKDNILFNF
eukprot:jgi/Botrbrau1/15611/Bobra.0264s0011.1